MTILARGKHMEFIKMSKKEILRLEILKSIIQNKTKYIKAAQMLGVSKRQLIRIVARYNKEGPEGILHKSRGRESSKKLPSEIKKKVVEVIHSETFKGFGPTFAVEQLSERYKISVSREWLRKVMISEGLWKSKRQKDLNVYQRRKRRSQEGELIQMDGSYEDWFEGRSPKCCLLVAIDDATSKIQELRFVKHETTDDYFELMKMFIAKRGRPLAVYTDRHAVFKTTRKEKVFKATQFARALNELEINLILANSPQAKGRVERANSTLQDRLIKSMRLDNICSMDEGNEYLHKFRETYNAKFSVRANNKENAYRTISENTNLEKILCVKETRKVSKQLEIQFDNNVYQIEPENNMKRRMIGKEVLIYKHASGVEIEYEGKSCKYREYKESNEMGMIMDRKTITAFLDRKKPLTAIQRYRRSG